MSFKLKILYYLVWLKITKWLYKNNLPLLQRIRVKKLFHRLENSPFYAPLVKANLPLSDFPVVNKALFMKHFDEINTRKIKLSDAQQLAEKAEISRDFNPMLQGITVGLSTGTSGNRAVFLANTNERALWVASMLDRVIGLTFRSRKAAFFLRANSNLYASTQSKYLGFNFFDIYRSIDEHVERLNKLQPDILTAQPSMLCLLAEKVKFGELNIKPTKIFSVAEVLYEEDKSLLEKTFGQTIHQVYQCTEGFLATTCKYGTLHFNDDFLIIEKKYVNDEKTKYHPIITDLLRITQPIVRYELNDIITEKKCCACGSKMQAIENIEGRSDDIMIFFDDFTKEVKLFPDIFRRTIVLSDELIADYCIIQTDYSQLQLYIKSESPLSYGIAKKSVESLLKEYSISNVTINKITTDPTIMGTKKRRVRNEIKHTR